VSPELGAENCPADRRQRMDESSTATAEAIFQKEPAICGGYQSREETVRNVLRSREQLCVVIHTRVEKERT